MIYYSSYFYLHFLYLDLSRYTLRFSVTNEQATDTMYDVNVSQAQWIQVAEMLMKQAQRKKLSDARSSFKVEWLRDPDLEG